MNEAAYETGYEDLMGASWAEVEAAAPELGARGRALLERHGFLLMATLRRAGAPRVSPVAVHLVEGRLALALIPRSLKALDLARDPRLALQSPVTGGERLAPGRRVAARHGRRRGGGAYRVDRRRHGAPELERCGRRPAERAPPPGHRGRRVRPLVAGNHSAMSEHEEPDEVREHERRVSEKDPAERSPIGEDEPGEAAPEDPAGTDRAPDDIPPGIGRLEE